MEHIDELSANRSHHASGSWLARNKGKTITGVITLALIVAVAAAIGLAGVGRSASSDEKTKPLNTNIVEALRSTYVREIAIAEVKSSVDSDEPPLSRPAMINQIAAPFGPSTGIAITRAQAVYAVNHLHVDWNRQAVGAASDRLTSRPYSRWGLIHELTADADQFTRAQAVYAVRHLHVDWNAEAVSAAIDALNSGAHYSRRDLLGELTLEPNGFTRAQAVYAADHVGR
jgi:Host cell surface-exposed lipoprotein